MPKTKATQEPTVDKIKLADGQEYEMARLTANMMAEVEERFDKSWEEITKPPMRKRPLIMVLWLRLKPNYPDLTEEQVGDLNIEDLLGGD